MWFQVCPFSPKADTQQGPGMDLVDKEKIHSSEGLPVLGSVQATPKTNHSQGRHCRTNMQVPVHRQYLVRASAFPRSLPEAPSLAFGSHRGTRQVCDCLKVPDEPRCPSIRSRHPFLHSPNLWVLPPLPCQTLSLSWVCQVPHVGCEWRPDLVSLPSRLKMPGAGVPTFLL